MAPNSFARTCRMSDAKYHSQFATSISLPVSKRHYKCSWVPKTATPCDDIVECQTPRMTGMSSMSTVCPSSPTSACPCQEESSSTCASDDDLSPVVCDFSSDSEHGDDVDIMVQTCVYSVMMMLRLRSSVCDSDRPGNVRYGSRYISDLEEAPVRLSSKASTGWRSLEGTTSQRFPHASADSWMAQQRNSTSDDDDAKFLRAARSILNKLTIEKFEPLFEQLTSCGIKQPHHISMLMREIFEKATIQHNFIPMYADLCVRLEKDPTISGVVKEAGEMHNFRRLLLNQCQMVFEQVLEPTDVEAEKTDIDEETSFRRKQRALGNMKLIGQLLAHGMLSSDLFVQCCEALLRSRSQCSEALEALVALMMVAGPTFDKTSWQFFSRFEKILADMRSLTNDKQTPPRLRFLIRDALDARDAGWPSRQSDCGKAVPAEEKKKTETLHGGSKPAVHPWRKVVVEKVEPPRDEQKFDVVVFRRTLAAVLSDLASDQNIPVAVQRIRMQQVPLAFQADQFVDILSRVAEERRGIVRRTQLAFITGLVAAECSAFDRQQCLLGIQHFFRDTYDDLCKEVHRLPAIMKSEFVPTIMTVIPAADINSVLPATMRR